MEKFYGVSNCSVLFETLPFTHFRRVRYLGLFLECYFCRIHGFYYIYIYINNYTLLFHIYITIKCILCF